VRDLRQTDGHCYPLAGGHAVSTLEGRLKVLEAAASGGDGGCERCSGLLVTVGHAITGELHSATWNGEAISEGELLERRTEERCPRCGRELNPDEGPVIKIGGRA
jgi:hypothetical protein